MDNNNISFNEENEETDRENKILKYPDKIVLQNN